MDNDKIAKVREARDRLYNLSRENPDGLPADVEAALGAALGCLNDALAYAAPRKPNAIRVTVEIAVPGRSLAAVEYRIDRALDFGSIQAEILSAAACERAESVNAFCAQVSR